MFSKKKGASWTYDTPSFTLCYNSLNICNIQVLYKIVRNGA